MWLTTSAAWCICPMAAWSAGRGRRHHAQHRRDLVLAGVAQLTARAVTRCGAIRCAGHRAAPPVAGRFARPPGQQPGLGFVPAGRRPLLRHPLGGPNPSRRCAACSAATDEHPRAALELAMCYPSMAWAPTATRAKPASGWSAARRTALPGPLPAGPAAGERLGRLRPARGLPALPRCGSLGHADATFGLASCLDADPRLLHHLADPLVTRARTFCAPVRSGSNLKGPWPARQAAQAEPGACAGLAFEMTSRFCDAARASHGVACASRRPCPPPSSCASETRRRWRKRVRRRCRAAS